MASPGTSLERATAQLALSLGSFPDFLRFVKVENTEFGGITEFQRWPHLIDMARSWQEGQPEIVLKARQLGVSWLLAAYVLWKAMYGPPSFLVLALSKGQIDSVELLRKAKVIYNNLPYHLQTPVERETLSEMEFTNAGRIISLPSTEDAGRGRTADLVVLDEFAFHPWADANLATLLPTIADGVGRQMLIVSTANGPSGRFYKLWEDPGDFITRFVPWYARPGRDDEWLERQRKRFVGLTEEFAREYPSTPQDAFRALTGLVYPQFEGKRHVYTHKSGSRTAHAVSRSRVRWEDFRYRLLGIDPGGGDPTALVPLGVDKNGHFWQPGEFNKRGPCSVDDMVAFIEKWDAIAPFDRIEIDAPPESAIPTQLLNMGYPAYGANKNRPARLNAQAWVLDNNLLHIHESCESSINEFYSYRWSERTDPHSKEKYRTSTPVDHHADAMDARGYAILYAMTFLIGREPEEFGEMIPEIDPDLERDLTPPWKRIF